MSALLREIEIKPAYDKQSEGYGQHCVEMTWYVKGPEGTIQFKLYTGWYPGCIPATTWSDWSDWSTLRVRKTDHSDPMPCDLGYHARTPQYEGQSPMREDCGALIGGGPCYYDGSGLNANKPFAILVHEGGERLWEFLEGYYVETFRTPAEPISA